MEGTRAMTSVPKTPVRVSATGEPRVRRRIDLGAEALAMKHAEPFFQSMVYHFEARDYSGAIWCAMTPATIAKKPSTIAIRPIK